MAIIKVNRFPAWVRFDRDLQIPAIFCDRCPLPVTFFERRDQPGLIIFILQFLDRITP
jgi:hypothetical protein